MIPVFRDEESDVFFSRKRVGMSSDILIEIDMFDEVFDEVLEAFVDKSKGERIDYLYWARIE